MDNIGEIVLVVLLLVGSLAQQIFKAAKKSKNRAEAGRSKDQNWEERHHPVFPAIESYDTQEKDEKRYFHYDTLDNSQELAISNDRLTKNTFTSIRADVKGDTPITSSDAKDEISDNRINDIMVGFELDKAIIYSELLNPKFKEY